MKRIKKISVLAASCVAALGFTSSSFAIMTVPTGWYIEADGGYANISNLTYGAGIGTKSTTGFGWSAGAGYKFMPYLAGEASYTNFPTSKATDATNSTTIANNTHYSYQVDFKGILPLSTSGAELFAKLGVARINSHLTITNASDPAASSLSSGSRTSTGVYMGLGGSYAFMPNLSGVVQWARAKGNNSTGTLDLYSVGLVYIVE